MSNKEYRTSRKFYSKYDLPSTEPRIYLDTDNVDRISYCDNTTMIKRAMLAGQRLVYNQSGLYNSEIALQDRDDIVVSPFVEDLIITTDKHKTLKRNIERVKSELNVKETKS